VSESLATWTDSLAGRALLHFMVKNGIAQAQKFAHAWAQSRRFAGMKPGFHTRVDAPPGVTMVNPREQSVPREQPGVKIPEGKSNDSDGHEK
jgi:hypothetical protein